MEYFILGMLMVQAFFPLIDGITSVLLSGFEIIKGYFGLKIAEYNTRIRRMAMDDEENDKRPIGFCYDNQEEENE